MGSTAYSESYTYDTEDGTLSSMTPAVGGAYTFTYDALKRLSGQSNDVYSKAYDYRDISTSQTTTQVETLSYSKVGSNSLSEFSLAYAYDALGNISSVTGTGRTDLTATYEYDVQGQLTKEVRGGETYEYSYDTYGNIRSVSGAESHTYTYGDSNWLDKLTAFDGTAISYDAIGNPLNWKNNTTWTSLTWENGRQLTAIVSSSKSLSFTYDLAGIRDSKTVTTSSGTTTYNFVTQNGQVVRQTWTDGTTSHVMDFIYDNQGRPYAADYDGTRYYYVLSLQGDVLRMVDTTGATVASYVYDAWGRILTSSGTLKDVNPLRYRGYYYDSETKLYYLGSRYYDPLVKRFINADESSNLGANSDFISYNLFTYCLNNPVARMDADGNLSVPNWVSVAAGITVIAVSAAATICSGGVLGVVAGAALTGAISGGIGGAIGGAISGAISGGVQGAIDGACSGFGAGAVIGGFTSALTSGAAVATGLVKVIGSAQKTGTLLHRAASNIEAGKMTLQAWKYSKVTLNRCLNTAGLNGRRMPDVIGIARNGTSKLIEVVSKSQTLRQMKNKCISMANANPGASYKVVGWAASVSRFIQRWK